MAFERDEHGRAWLGGVCLADLCRRPNIPTPFYAYDVDGAVDAARALDAGFGDQSHLICYAVKANSAGRFLRRFAGAGLGADVVSGGELVLCLASNYAPDRIVWSGVAKSDDDMDLALRSGDRGILAVQLESIEEMVRIEARAQQTGRRARVSLRINPGVEIDSHAHIATGHDEAKFGIPAADLGRAYEELRCRPALELVGLSMHIGSQMKVTSEFARAGQVLCDAARAAEAVLSPLSFLDFGGGYGVAYEEGDAGVPPAAFAHVSREIAQRNGFAARTLLCEPGRSLVASQGVLVTRLIQEKRWSRPTSVGWLLLDAGMNDLLRPALYGAHHRIEPLTRVSTAPVATWRVAGPICESSDDFGTYELPAEPPEHFVVRDAGAYGYTMASTYNGRGLATEVFLEGGQVVSVSQTVTRDAWLAGRVAT